MKAAMIQSGDEFWHNGELVYTVEAVERKGHIIFVDFRTVEGGEGTTVFFEDDDSLLRAPSITYP